MSRVRVREQMPIQGVVTARHIATKNGVEIPWSEVEKSLASRGIKAPRQTVKQNLVVESGRSQLAQLLGGDSSAFIDRVQLGDTKIAGVVQKTALPPDLSDVALVNEIRTLLGAPGATFSLDQHTYPATVTKTEPAGLPGTLVAGVVSTFSDPGADFVADGVNDSDVLTVFIGGEDFSFGINEVTSPTLLEVENASNLSGSGLGYNIKTPSGQVLFTKLISGNNFPESQFGTSVKAHEAGLLFSNGTLFNRVVFVPGDDTTGLILQPGTVDGTVISIQLDWLITF